jgi:hypothetical protein
MTDPLASHGSVTDGWEISARPERDAGDLIECEGESGTTPKRGVRVIFFTATRHAQLFADQSEEPYEVDVFVDVTQLPTFLSGLTFELELPECTMAIALLQPLGSGAGYLFGAEGTFRRVEHCIERVDPAAVSVYLCETAGRSIAAWKRVTNWGERPCYRLDDSWLGGLLRLIHSAPLRHVLPIPHTRLHLIDNGHSDHRREQFEFVCAAHLVSADDADVTVVSVVPTAFGHHTHNSARAQWKRLRFIGDVANFRFQFSGTAHCLNLKVVRCSRDERQ